MHKTYDEWAKDVGIIPETESREAWDYQERKMRTLLQTITYCLDNFKLETDEPGDIQLKRNVLKMTRVISNTIEDISSQFM
jgi:hypothetical protein